MAPPVVIPIAAPSAAVNARLSASSSSSSASSESMAYEPEFQQPKTQSVDGIVDSRGLNDIQRRTAHIVGAQLAETRKQEVQAAKAASTKLLSLWNQTIQSQLRKDAEIGDAKAIAQLTALKAQVDASTTALGALQLRFAVDEAEELRKFVLKVLQVELQPVSDSSTQARGFSNTGGEAFHFRLAVPVYCFD